MACLSGSAAMVWSEITGTVRVNTNKDAITPLNFASIRLMNMTLHTTRQYLNGALVLSFSIVGVNVEYVRWLVVESIRILKPHFYLYVV